MLSVVPTLAYQEPCTGRAKKNGRWEKQTQKAVSAHSRSVSPNNRRNGQSSSRARFRGRITTHKNQCPPTFPLSCHLSATLFRSHHILHRTIIQLFVQQCNNLKTISNPVSKTIFGNPDSAREGALPTYPHVEILYARSKSLIGSAKKYSQHHIEIHNHSIPTYVDHLNHTTSIPAGLDHVLW